MKMLSTITHTVHDIQPQGLDMGEKWHLCTCIISSLYQIQLFQKFIQKNWPKKYV